MPQKTVLMVIAPDNFKDEEFYKTKQILEENNIKVVSCSSVQEAKSVEGKHQVVDILLGEAHIDYDALVFIGGPGTEVYFNDNFALALARNFNEKNKIVAAICIAPVILANSGILEGKKATVFPSGSKNLEEKGANYTGSDVEKDLNIITAVGPNAIEGFTKEIIKALK